MRHLRLAGTIPRGTEALKTRRQSPTGQGWSSLPHGLTQGAEFKTPLLVSFVPRPMEYMCQVFIDLSSLGAFENVDTTRMDGRTLDRFYKSSAERLPIKPKHKNLSTQTPNKNKTPTLGC